MRDLGVPNFLSELRRALDLLESEVWLSILHDSTSPRVVLLRLSKELLRCEMGDVGCIPIPEHIWDSIVLEDFQRVAGWDLQGVPSPSEHATIMVLPLRGQRLLHPEADKGLKPNSSVFAIPKSAEKASLIVNMVPFNRAMATTPLTFS